MRLVHAMHCCFLTATLAAIGCGSSHSGAADGGTGRDASADAKEVAKPDAKSGDARVTPEGGEAGNAHDAGVDSHDGVDAKGGDDSGEPADGGSGTDAGASDSESGQNIDAAPPPNDKCANATPIQINANAAHVDIPTTTLGATHDIDAPCVSDHGADVYYSFGVSKRVFVYADTFDATWDTVLYLLASDCTALTASTTTGDAICNDNACGKKQSQVAALLEPGDYVLGLSGRGNSAGTATLHFEYALAGGGAASPLSQGNTVSMGSTSGTSNITDINSSCIAAGAEDSYWWMSCPGDVGGSLAASTCGAATWETVLELEIPATAPYVCSLDACDLQTTLNAMIPAGAGLRVLAVDGEGGSDEGAYTLTSARP